MKKPIGKKYELTRRIIENHLAALLPKVGIFFYVDAVTIMDAVQIEKGEPYGEAIQYGGHYEFWEALVPKTLSERKLKARAYDAYPRGRVVYFPGEKKYIIYGDRCISKSEFGIIANKQFELEEVVEKGFEIGIEFDLHYKCAGCNPHFAD